MARRLGKADATAKFLVWILASAVWTAVGCGGKKSETVPEFGRPETAYVPRESSGNAFDGYALAALKAETDGVVHLSQVRFTPDSKDKAVKRTQAALSMLRQATSLPSTFEFRARGPFDEPPFHRGWRLIGRVLVWSIQDAVVAGDYDLAISDTLVAHRFGFDLTHGGAMDASLGLVVVDDARRAIAPYLGRLGAEQLGRLSEGIRSALDRKGTLNPCFANEGKNMLVAVQTLQDAYFKDSWEQVRTGLGSSARDSIRSLDGLEREDAVAYFQGMADEATAEVAILDRAASMSAEARSRLIPEEPEGSRPWATFAKHFLGTGRPILAMNDATLVRTRLLAIHAELYRQAKARRSIPQSLEGWPPMLVLDSFSGKPFLYESAGLDFNVYSVGANFQDDGGATDDSFTVPDLCLER